MLSIGYERTGGRDVCWLVCGSHNSWTVLWNCLERMGWKKVCASVWRQYRYIYFANPPQWVFAPFFVPWSTTCPKLLCYTWTLLESICASMNNCWDLHTRTAWLLFSINLGQLRSGLSVSLSFLSLSLLLSALSLPFSFSPESSGRTQLYLKSYTEREAGR